MKSPKRKSQQNSNSKICPPNFLTEGARSGAWVSSRSCRLVSLEWVSLLKQIDATQNFLYVHSFRVTWHYVTSPMCTELRKSTKATAIAVVPEPTALDSTDTPTRSLSPKGRLDRMWGKGKQQRKGILLDLSSLETGRAGTVLGFCHSG